MRNLLAILVALMAQPPVAVGPSSAAGLPPRPVAFKGFVADPFDAMARIGVRVAIEQTVDANGHQTIAVRVFDRARDEYRNLFWQERTALCRPVIEEPPPAPTRYEPPEEKPPSWVVFDRLHHDEHQETTDEDDQ